MDAYNRAHHQLGSEANLSDAELDHRVRAAAVESAEQRRADAQAKLQGASDDDYAAGERELKAAEQACLRLCCPHERPPLR